MFNKFELIGISASIMSMAVALYMINMHTTAAMFATVPKADTQNAIVAVSSEGNQQQALRAAIVDAANDNGTVKKMIIDDVILGNGLEAQTGDSVTVHYVGTLQNGDEFDNSRKRGSPFTFTLGEGKVIKGWDEGVVGMKAGGKRILVIPAEKAYGKNGYGPIPADATLVFAIELMSINK